MAPSSKRWLSVWVGSWLLLALLTIVLRIAFVPELYVLAKLVILLSLIAPVGFLACAFTQRPRPRGVVLLVAPTAAVVGYYALLNVLIVNYLAISQPCVLAVTAVDAGSGAGIPDASVSLRSAFGELREASDAKGSVLLAFRVVEQPQWVWPRLGRYRLRNHWPLRVGAPGYLPSEIALADRLSNRAYSADPIDFEVRLEPATVPTTSSSPPPPPP